MSVLIFVPAAVFAGCTAKIPQEQFGIVAQVIKAAVGCNIGNGVIRLLQKIGAELQPVGIEKIKRRLMNF